MNRNSFVDRVFQLFFSPDDGIGDVSGVPHGQSGDVEIMGRTDETPDDDAEGNGPDDDAEEPDPGTGEKKETPDDEGPEVFDEEEEGDEKEGDEEEELDEDGNPKVKEGEEEEVFEGRPTLKDIKTKYPKIFKEFPELRQVLFREQKFTENFGTVEEAETAAVKATSFDTIEAALLAGDSSPIVDQLAANAPDALQSVVDNFLPTILAKSQDLYLRATVPVIEQLLFTAFNTGKDSNNANLMRSAQHLAQFLTGKPDIPDPSRRGRDRGPHPAEKKLEEERATWEQTRFNEASSEVNSAIDTELESEILKGFSTQGMTDRQKARFIKDIKDEIDATLGKDEAFKRQMKSLWVKAKTANYTKDQRASIKSAFLARAKALVPSVRTRLRAEWFGDKTPNFGKSATDKNKQGQQPPKKRTIPQSGQAPKGTGNRPPSAKEVDFSKTSDMDLIEGRFHRRK